MDFNHRSVHLWLLDFDQCQEFPHTPAGLEQLKKGFWQNDPYYPRPVSTHEKDVTLWAIFKKEYLTASAEFTDKGMPEEFIVAVEAEGKKRRAGNSMFQ